MSRKLALSAALLALFAAPAQAGSTITDIVLRSGGEFDENPHDFDLLLNAVLAVPGLAGVLGDEDASLTVFAPNDGAFIQLARDLGYDGEDEEGAFDFIVAALTDLGGGDFVPVLGDVLGYHVLPKQVGVFRFVIAAIFRIPLTTTLGITVHPFLLGLVDREPDLPDPNLTFPIGLRASNGVIHSLDGVLLPVDL